MGEVGSTFMPNVLLQGASFARESMRTAALRSTILPLMENNRIAS
jgi:hypothetical protein